MGTGASWPSSRASLVSSERGLMGGGERFAGWLVGLIDGAWLFFFLSFFLFGVRPVFVHHRQTFQAPALALLNRVVHTAVVVGGGLLGRGSTLLFLFVCSCLCGWFCFGFACNAHR